MNPAAQRVVVTGMGAVSPFGEGAGTLWRNLREGRSAIGPLRHAQASLLRARVAAQVPEGFDPSTRFDERVLPMLDRVSQFAMLAAREAIAQAGIAFDTDRIRARTAVVIGTGAGGETSHEEQAKRLYAETQRDFIRSPSYA